MLYKPTSGTIRFRGSPVADLKARRDVLAYRGQVPMVFQDPFSSLNPAHTVSYAMMRGLKSSISPRSPGESGRLRPSGCWKPSGSCQPGNRW